MAMGRAENKFSLIHEAILDDDNILTVSEMCKAAGVSRSGYYRWVEQATFREKQEQKDREDFQLIVTAYNHRGYSKGARSIYMQLLHNKPPVCMNLKKIRRLMEKYGLKCPIRKANPYRRMAKAIKTNHVAPYLLDRQFKVYGPRKVLLTDITYLFYENHKCCYLSVIMDAYTKQALSWVVSDSLELDFVLKTVEILVEKHGISLSEETLINSDQGCHYTSCKFIEIVRNAGLRQSMSRKANCWDNAPQESFFGHMKDEIKIGACRCFSDVQKAIDDWFDYYNNERYQWSLAKLSPNEYYEYVCTGEYPLPHNSDCI